MLNGAYHYLDLLRRDGTRPARDRIRRPGYAAATNRGTEAFPATEVMVRDPGTEVLDGRSDVARDRPFFGACGLLFLTSAGATIAWCGSMSGGMAMPGGWTMSMAWMTMPGQTLLGAATSFMVMWVLMMMAMMLPSLVPMLSAYRRSLRGLATIRRGRLTVVAGTAYFLVWGAVGAAAYPLGVVLGAVEMRWEALARSVPIATGVVVLLAGCLQLTPWKARHLGHCRAAPVCGGSRSPDVGGAWRHGLSLGVRCSLCCSGLMMILLVTGVMDLGAMAVVAAAITLERLAPQPHRAARATGVVVIIAGAVVILRGVLHS